MQMGRTSFEDILHGRGRGSTNREERPIQNSSFSSAPSANMPILGGSTSASPIAHPTTSSFPTAHPTTSSPPVSSALHVQSEASVAESTNGRRRLNLDPGSGSFLQSHAASAAITRSFLLRLSDKGHAWKTVPDDVKDFYWLEFQKEFIWDPELESVIKRRWLQQAATRYSDTLSKWRASGSKPSRVPEHVWDSWQKEWSTVEFKQRSTIASKNRLSETGGSGSGPSRHTGGSISMVERSIRMVY